MAQYHMDLTDDAEALEAEAIEAGFNSWDEYYWDRNWWYMNRDRPLFGGWLAKNALSEELFIMERNPYFFGVDPDGKQLPYLDTVTHRLFESNEVFNMWIVNGEIDFQNRHVNIANYSLFKENEENGDYRVYLGASAGHTCLQPNHATKNDRLREFFQDRNVRLAMSYAVNRVEMNELVYDGLLVPRQYSPLPLSPNYYPKLSEAHLDYDPEYAMELLDEAGYTEKDGEGFRLWKDGSGETLSFIIEGTAEPGSPGEDAAQLVVKYFADVGIKATYKYFERSLYTEHFEANEIEAAWWGGDRTVVPLAPGAPIFRGTMIDRPWADGWGLWFNSNGTDPNGVEPPAGHWIWDIWDIWSQIEVEPSEDKRNELFNQIMDIWAEELPMIGYLGETPAPIIVKNGFKNYKEGMPIDDTTGDEHLLNTESYYWENPEEHM
jgi:peptide/nickel transport system substrate-binding protein